MTGPPEPRRVGSHWTVALFALPVLCCVGPALLAALGAGALGTLLGGATGNIALAVAGLAIVCAAVVVLLGRRQGR